MRLDDREILFKGSLNHETEVVAGILCFFEIERLLVVGLLVEVLVHLIDLQPLVVYQATQTTTHSVVLPLDLK